MVRGRGRCGGCQAVLHKFRNKVIDRRCGSCSATLSEYDRYAYHCELCQRFACKQCTNASRGSSVAPKPLLACDGCQGVLVRMRITRAFVNRPCHNCSSTFEYLDWAYHCDSCTRITCKLCTWDLRLRAAARSCRVSPVRGLTGIRGLTCSIHRPTRSPKRPRLSPAAGTAESEVRTTEQQPVRRWLISTSGYRQRWTHPVLMSTRAGADG